MVNILIADDSPFIRTAYKRVLETQADFVVSSVCEDGLEAVEKCSQLEIDVAVLDIRMPRLDGIAASKTIRENNPSISVVVVSAYDDWSYVKDLIETDSKSKAYVLKNSLDDIGELIRIVRKVMLGHLILDNALIEKLIGYYERHSLDSGNLSGRELEVISRGCKGMNLQEIASDLEIPPADVEVIQGLVEEKLNVSGDDYLSAQANSTIAFLNLCVSLSLG
jgi:DNA-binding NarL/FixJ family response regulator|tara:strand:- start:1078 stop:1743 length:666 start_codon:yes stop_codon:yes gene_type:complete